MVYQIFSKILRDTFYCVITVSDISEVFSIDFHPTNGVVIPLVRSNFCLRSVTNETAWEVWNCFLLKEVKKVKVMCLYRKVEVNS